MQVNVWRKGVTGVDAAGKDKEIFTLFLDTITVAEAVADLVSMATMVKTHIYVAYSQWEFARSIPTKLTPMNSVFTVEDYKRNAEVMLEESPTETNFGKHNIQIAIYPTYLAFRLEQDGPIQYAAITFVSFCYPRYECPIKMSTHNVTKCITHNKEPAYVDKTHTYRADACQHPVSQTVHHPVPHTVAPPTYET